jgi:hypothetical protein
LTTFSDLVIDPKLIDPKHDGLLFGVCRTDKKDKMTFAASTRKERDEWVELIQLQAESVDKTDIKKLKNKSLHLSGTLYSLFIMKFHVNIAIS